MIWSCDAFAAAGLMNRRPARSPSDGAMRAAVYHMQYITEENGQHLQRSTCSGHFIHCRRITKQNDQFIAYTSSDALSDAWVD
jgi:hypothetical protein